jgi:hypothetical protein
MKVIFLDIDGVLNCSTTENTLYGYDFVDEDKLVRLKRIIDQTGAVVVLTSTWRIGWYHSDDGHITEAADMFVELERELLKYGIELMDKTPMFRGGMSVRGQEIKRWIENQDEEIESFVILEDWESLWPYNEDNIVWVDETVGLSEADAERAVKILGKKICDW